MERKLKKFKLSPIIGWILAIAWMFPFYLMIVNSLKTKKEIFTNTLGTPENLTFENYPNAYESLDFGTMFSTSQGVKEMASANRVRFLVLLINDLLLRLCSTGCSMSCLQKILAHLFFELLMTLSLLTCPSSSL